MKKMFLLAGFIIFYSITALGQDITGPWKGLLEAGPQKLRIVFHITSDGQGYVSTMDSPDQSAKGISIAETRFDGKRLSIREPKMHLSYEGDLLGDTIKGVFTQMGSHFPLDFTRGDYEPNVRPQEPRAPFPYKIEEVTFVNEEAGIRLAGTFTFPAARGRYPAVILVSGSGAQNRNEEIMDHKPFLVLADYLTRQGIAVLRYDDRGVGGSEGDYPSASMYDFASDARAALKYLNSRPETRRGRAGIIGHSQGGMIAIILAGEGTKGLDFIVSMAGPAINGFDFMEAQRERIYEAMGLPEEVRQSQRDLVEGIYKAYEIYGPNPAEEVINDMIDMIVPAEQKDNAQAREVIRVEYFKAASPESRSMLEYVPGPYLEKIKCPVLAINGSLDVQVISGPNLEAFSRGVRKITVKEYEGLNHLFQHATTGMPFEYGKIEETISEEVLGDIARWILGL